MTTSTIHLLKLHQFTYKNNKNIKRNQKMKYKDPL